MPHFPISRSARPAIVAALTTVAALLATTSASGAPRDGWRALPARHAPAANPLEGFVPYAGGYSTFPYSMEWFYLPLNAVMTGPDRFNWRALVRQLSAISARGHWPLQLAAVGRDGRIARTWTTSWRFANAGQDTTVPGRLTLGRTSIA